MDKLFMQPEDNPLLARFRDLAAELSVVLPISFFEKAGQAYYNSVVVFDADGSNLGIYRKSHIPDGPGYQEKFYFNPGDTGFKVFETKYANIGVGICWDQWFPECARCMALLGAEILFYPTAIGSEPQDQTIDSRHHWRRVMQGHAGANIVPVIASNRIGKEVDITFYGTSFITDHLGAILVDADDHSEAVLIQSFDLDYIRDYRSSWGVFRDRRTDLYKPILTLDGGNQSLSNVRHLNRIEKQSVVVPRDVGFRMPGEFEPHLGCWMAWPLRSDNWRDDAKYAQLTFLNIVAAISNFEPVCVLVKPSVYVDVSERLQSLRCKFPVRPIQMEYDDIWLRDIGPTFLINDQKGLIGGVKWDFNAWGGLDGGCYSSWRHDNEAGNLILRNEKITNTFRANFVLEGGSFHVDGEGTVIVTEECLLNKNRNPNLSMQQIEEKLRQYLNVSVIIWLPFGVFGDDDTNGHIDNIACFARPGEVILAWTDDENDYQYERSKIALDILKRAVDAQGRKLTVHKLLMPNPLHIKESEAAGLHATHVSQMIRAPGTRLAASYVNFYIANGGIIVPGFDDPIHDALAVQNLQSIFGPQYEVVQIQTREIILGGGNIHCITQQQPIVSKKIK